MIFFPLTKNDSKEVQRKHFDAVVSFFLFPCNKTKITSADAFTCTRSFCYLFTLSAWTRRTETKAAERGTSEKSNPPISSSEKTDFFFNATASSAGDGRRGSPPFRRMDSRSQGDAHHRVSVAIVTLDGRKRNSWMGCEKLFLETKKPLKKTRAFVFFFFSSHPCPFVKQKKQGPDHLHLALRLHLASAASPGTGRRSAEATSLVRGGGASSGDDEDESGDGDDNDNGDDDDDTTQKSRCHLRATREKSSGDGSKIRPRCCCRRCCSPSASRLVRRRMRFLRRGSHLGTRLVSRERATRGRRKR